MFLEGFQLRNVQHVINYKFLSSNVSFGMYMLKVKFNVDDNIPPPIDHVNH
jgi:hypothetical protein